MNKLRILSFYLLHVIIFTLIVFSQNQQSYLSTYTPHSNEN